MTRSDLLAARHLKWLDGRGFKIGPLRLLSKTSSRRTFNIAYWHSWHSLTWRWGLSVSWLPGTGQRAFGFFPFRTNNGLQWRLAVWPFDLHWSVQRPMWYRDIYMRQRDEQDRQKYLESSRRHRVRELFGQVEE